MDTFFFYMGKKVMTSKDELVLPACIFVEKGPEFGTVILYERIFWRLYKRPNYGGKK